MAITGEGSEVDMQPVLESGLDLWELSIDSEGGVSTSMIFHDTKPQVFYFVLRTYHGTSILLKFRAWRQLQDG